MVRYSSAFLVASLFLHDVVAVREISTGRYHATQYEEIALTPHSEAVDGATQMQQRCYSTLPMVNNVARYITVHLGLTNDTIAFPSGTKKTMSEEGKPSAYDHYQC